MQAISAPTEALTGPKAPTLGFTRAKRVTRLTGQETATDRLRRVLPWTTRATNTFATGVYRVPAREAVKMRELALDPPGWVTALKFDVDTPDAGMAHIEAGLPAPNFIVKNPANGHAHLIYLLKSWVQVDPSKKATRWLASIERAFTAALGADVRYSGTLCHNPLDTTDWNVMVPRDEPFTLAELHQHVDMHVPIGKPNAADSGIGRNVTVFDRTRMWAYGVAAKGSESTFSEWSRLVQERAESFNSFAEHPQGDLPASEIRSIAKSVATWVWEKYAQRAPDPEAEARRREHERERQKRREAARHRSLQSRTEYTARAAERRSWASKWRTEGIPAREIAERLSCSIREVYRLLSDAHATVIRTYATAKRVVRRVVQGPPAPSGSCTPGTGEGVDLLAYARQRIGAITGQFGGKNRAGVPPRSLFPEIGHAGSQNPHETPHVRNSPRSRRPRSGLRRLAIDALPGT